MGQRFGGHGNLDQSKSLKNRALEFSIQRKARGRLPTRVGNQTNTPDPVPSPSTCSSERHWVRKMEIVVFIPVLPVELHVHYTQPETGLYHRTQHYDDCIKE